MTEQWSALHLVDRCAICDQDSVIRMVYCDPCPDCGPGDKNVCRECADQILRDALACRTGAAELVMGAEHWEVSGRN